MFKFKLITPFKTILETDVYMTVIPAEKGALGVLKNHAPMMVSLMAGNVDLYESPSTVFKRFKIEQGYGHIFEEGCFLFVENAQEVSWTA